MGYQRLLGTLALAGSLLAPSLHAQLNDVPNAVKYRDSSIPNATGRSGNASIEAQALLGKDGVTELAVSTAAPGTIDKLQVKAAGSTQNYTNLGGAVVTQQLSGLFRHETFDVQANVAGIDADREDVVAATGTVKLRPDLTVYRLFVPPHAAVGLPIPVTALIREHNGDTGGRADVVLRVNGVEVDRANGIWVDADGTVTCELTCVFPNAGDQQVEVALTNNTPADWEPRNDTATAPVHVYENASAFDDWYASADDEQWQTASTYRTAHGSDDSGSEGAMTTMAFSGHIRGATRDTWLGLTISYEEEQDGVRTVNLPEAHYSSGVRSCLSGVNGGIRVQKCYIAPSLTNPDGVVSLSISRGGGDVTYYSHGWYEWYDGSGNYDRYTYNYEGTQSFGPRFTIGQTATMRVTASDGTRFFSAEPHITPQFFTRTDELPYTCYTSDVEWCYSYRETHWGRAGEDASQP